MRTAATAASMGRWWRSAVVVVVAVLCAVVGPVQAASAHSPLESSTPRSGAQLTSLPQQIELTFGAAVKDEDARVVVADEQGTDWAAGRAVVDETFVSTPVKPGAPDGRYEIRWSVVSFDGASMSGTVGFTVGTAATAPGLFDRVLAKTDAFWVGTAAVSVVALLLAYMAFGLFTVYGPRAHRREPAIPAGATAGRRRPEGEQSSPPTGSAS